VKALTVMPDLESLVLEIRLSRVFIFRVWLGTQLLKLAMWVIGGQAEVLPRSE
jgi:hypothetical protein